MAGVACGKHRKGGKLRRRGFRCLVCGWDGWKPLDVVRRFGG